MMDDALKEIKKTRARNNDLWMEILDVALRCSPVVTKRILAQINANDQAVSSLLKEIVDDED